jgi:nitroreductase
MLHRLKHIAKRLLAIAWIRNLYQGTVHASLEVFGAHRVLSVPYSMVNFLAFNREQFAVLRGRRDYYRNLKTLRRSHTELRRNVHRLEKGLLMQPRRDVFAVDYIGETLDFYERAIRRCSQPFPDMETDELTWAHGVLHEYFGAVDNTHPVVASAHKRFAHSLAHFSTDDRARVPYARQHGQRSTIDYDDLLQLARQRRSTRWYEPRAVPRKLVDKALLVARQSPTACNRLPYEFRIFDDKRMVEKVAAVPFGTAGYAHQIPTIAVVTGRLSHYFSARDRHIIYVDSSLAAMAFMLALETQGLASSVINWPDFEPLERKMQKTLGLDSDERVIMLIAIGYPDPEGKVAFSEKKSLDVLRSYNRLPGSAKLDSAARPHAEPSDTRPRAASATMSSCAPTSPTSTSR